jgi:hypothetical protein
MKEVTLTTGRVVQIASTTIAQSKEMVEMVAAGHPMEATVKFCAEAMQRAGSAITIEEFESTFTIAEANELFDQAAEVSSMALGEKKATV